MDKIKICKLLLIATIVLLVFGCTSEKNLYIDIKDLEDSLPKETITVGFDIDDTVLFSSPCWQKLRMTVASNHSELSGPITDETWQKIKNIENIWDKVALCSEYTLPKELAIDLIKIHQKRGDQVYFITARTSPSEGYKKFLDEYLAKIIGSKKNLHPVIYAYPKQDEIIKNNIEIYYGDSDSDIEASIKADIWGIRFLRAKNSNTSTPYNIGKYKEEILLNSDK